MGKMVRVTFFYENLDFAIQTAYGFIEFLWRFYCRKPFGDISFGSISRDIRNRFGL